MTTLTRQEASLHPQRRFDAPLILPRHGISCLEWAEDAMQHYGDRGWNPALFILVENPEEAGQCLKNSGYYRTPQNEHYTFHA